MPRRLNPSRMHPECRIATESAKSACYLTASTVGKNEYVQKLLFDLFANKSCSDKRKNDKVHSKRSTKTRKKVIIVI